MSRLAKAELILFVALIGHLVDHSVNQPSREVPALAGALGAIGFGLIALAFILTLGDNPRAAESGLFAGLGTIAGFAVVHLLPDWTPLSDPYWDFDANVLSWILLITPVVLATWVAVEAARRLDFRVLTT